MKSKTEKALKKKKYKDGMVQGHSVGSTVADVIIIIVLCIVALICLIPMWHVLMSSLYGNPEQLITEKGITWWFGSEINFNAYKILFTEMGGTFAQGNIFRGLVNTIVYMAVNVVYGLIINVIAGYCLSRGTKLKTPMRMFCMLSLIFSAGTIPLYIVLRNIGFTGTVWSLVVPMCTNGMFMIMAMNAFFGVPAATVEAARIDGAGHFKIMFSVMLPQAMGLITVIMINTAILHWNSWFQASIYVTNVRELWPMQLWVKYIMENSGDYFIVDAITGEFPWDKYLLQFAVIIVSTVPILLAFPFFYKKLEKNTVAGAVKG